MNFLKSMRSLIPFYLVFLQMIAVSGFSQTMVQVSIDAGTAGRAVSPYIYGKNNSLYDNPSYGTPLTAQEWQLLRDAGITMFRESGGNNSTKYNWRRELPV